MKKGILFALAALCVSAVQAVTFDWTDGKGFTDTNGKQVQLTGAATFTIVFTMPNVTGMAGDIISLKTASGEKLGFANWSGHSVNYVGGQTTITSGGHYSNARFYNNGTGVNTLTITFPEIASDGRNQIAWSFDGANGDKNYNDNEKYTRTWLTGDLLFTDIVLGDGVNISSIKMTTDSYTTVPEPTALALLALGVAGLALRRKVA